MKLHFQVSGKFMLCHARNFETSSACLCQKCWILKSCKPCFSRLCHGCHSQTELDWTNPDSVSGLACGSQWQRHGWHCSNWVWENPCSKWNSYKLLSMLKDILAVCCGLSHFCFVLYIYSVLYILCSPVKSFCVLAAVALLYRSVCGLGRLLLSL